MGRILFLMSLAACAPAGRATKAPRPVAMGSQMVVEPAPAVPLGGLDSPFEREFLPPLHGDATTLDLKSLVRSQLDYTISMDTQPLADLDKSGRVALISLLAADPRWRVYEEQDLLFAARRAPLVDGWTVSANGYHPTAGGPWRTQLRFGAYAPDHPWRASTQILEVAAGTPQVKVRGFVPAASIYRGSVITAMRIEATLVSLDLYESGPEDGRPHTGDALSEVPAAVANATLLADRLNSRGHEPLLLPANEPKTAAVAVAVHRTEGGEVAWQARVNPGEPGWVWLRLVDGDRAWQEPNVAAATRERVGWADGGERTFFAQSRFHLPDDLAFDGTAEVWFLPDVGDARVLTQMPARLAAR